MSVTTLSDSPAKPAAAKGFLTPSVRDLRHYKDAFYGDDSEAEALRAFIAKNKGLELQLQRINDRMLTCLPTGAFEYPDLVENDRRYPENARMTLYITAAYDKMKRDYSRRSLFHHQARLAQEAVEIFGLQDTLHSRVLRGHDLIEDPKQKLDTIESIAGAKVAQGIVWLTDNETEKTDNWETNLHAKARFKDWQTREIFIEHPYAAIWKSRDTNDGPRSDGTDLGKGENRKTLEVRGDKVFIINADKPGIPLKRFQLKTAYADKFMADYFTVARGVGHWTLKGIDPTYAEMADHRESQFFDNRDDLKERLHIDVTGWKKLKAEVLKRSEPLHLERSSRPQTLFGEPDDESEMPTRRRFWRMAASVGGIGYALGRAAVTGSAQVVVAAIQGPKPG